MRIRGALAATRRRNLPQRCWGFFNLPHHQNSGVDMAVEHYLIGPEQPASDQVSPKKMNWLTIDRAFPRIYANRTDQPARWCGGVKCPPQIARRNQNGRTTNQDESCLLESVVSEPRPQNRCPPRALLANSHSARPGTILSLKSAHGARYLLRNCSCREANTIGFHCHRAFPRPSLQHLRFGWSGSSPSLSARSGRAVSLPSPRGPLPS